MYDVLLNGKTRTYIMKNTERHKKYKVYYIEISNHILTYKHFNNTLVIYYIRIEGVEIERYY